MDWVPIVFVTFKAIVLCTGMFFAVKWHYDQGKKANGERGVLRAGGKVAAVFLISLLVVGLIAFELAKMLGLDMTFP